MSLFRFVCDLYLVTLDGRSTTFANLKSCLSFGRSTPNRMSPTKFEDESINISILRDMPRSTKQNKITETRALETDRRAASGTIVPCARKVILRKLTSNGPINGREFGGRRRVGSRFLFTNVRLLRCWGGCSPCVHHRSRRTSDGEEGRGVERLSVLVLRLREDKDRAEESLRVACLWCDGRAGARGSTACCLL